MKLINLIAESRDRGLHVWTDEGEAIIVITNAPPTMTQEQLNKEVDKHFSAAELQHIHGIPDEGQIVSREDQKQFSNLPHKHMTMKGYIADLRAFVDRHAH